MTSEKIKTLFQYLRHVDKSAFYTSLETLKEQYENLSVHNDKLRNQVVEWNKDDEIQKLEQRLDEMRRLSIYIRTEKEMKEEAEYRKAHSSRCNGRVLYSFGGNGIGSWYELSCEKCGEIMHIADVDSW